MIYSTFYGTHKTKTIIVNGVTMTVKEFKTKYQVKTKPKKKAKHINSITILPSEIKVMMKGIKTLKSFVAYYEHGYRQWGNVAKYIITLKDIELPFIHVVTNTKQATDIIEEINMLAKRNSKDVFQYVRDLSWKLDDVKNDLDLLTTGISKSGVLDRFGTHECINGTGKRLGLQTLMQRTYSTIKNLNAICLSLEAISNNGLDISEYDGNGRHTW